MLNYGCHEILGTKVNIVSKKLLVLRRSIGKNAAPANPPFTDRKCIRIFCCISGSSKHLIGGKTIWVKKGDLVFVPKDMEYQLLEIMSESYDEISLILFPSYFDAMTVLHPEIVRSMERRKKDGSYIFRPTGKGHQNYIQAFETMYEEHTTCRLGWGMVLYSTAACVLAAVFRPEEQIGVSPAALRNEALIEQILAYIEAQYGDPLTVEEVGRHFMIGSSKLSKLFRQYVGTSCYQYIIKCRLAAAQVYLLEGIPAKQVWSLCGFPDYASFYRHYKKQYGVSPSRFISDVYASRDRNPQIP